MKRERVIANAALTPASGGKLKALLGQPFEILFSWAIGWGTRSEQCVLTLNSCKLCCVSIRVILHLNFLGKWFFF